MKKSVILIVLFFAAFITNAQTLQFSQVKLVGSVMETVPAGKVWKVESVMSTSTMVPSTGTLDNTYYSVSKIVEINGQNIVISRASRYTQSNSRYNSESTTDVSVSNVTELPLWLPAGTTLRASTNATSVSIIEFNVVQP